MAFFGNEVPSLDIFDLSPPLRHDLADFYRDTSPTGIELKGSILTRAIFNLVGFSMFVFVPLFYFAIFKFRANQDTVSGKDSLLFTN